MRLTYLPWAPNRLSRALDHNARMAVHPIRLARSKSVARVVVAAGPFLSSSACSVDAMSASTTVKEHDDG